MNLIFIYGAPATGKLTVAKELARLTNYKLFHNHLTVDLVRSLFEFESEQAGRLSTKFRLEMFEEAAKAKLNGVIFTFVYAKGHDDVFVQQVVDILKPYNGNVYFILLKCDQEELLNRVQEKSRSEYRKIHDPEKLKGLIQDYEMFSPIPGQNSLIIDNTQIAPKEVAEQIVQHFQL